MSTASSTRGQLPTLIDHLAVSIKLAMKSLIYSKKWLLYLILSLVPLFLTALSTDPLLGNSTAQSAYVDVFVGTILFLFFTFSCLLLALPVSGDEISDRFFELILVRPVRKEVLWTARWIVTHVSVFVLNFVIASMYFVYFHFVDDNSLTLDELARNVDLLQGTALLLMAATLIYGGLFLTVGFIGRRGLSIGIIIAIFELLFLNTLFLTDEPYIPRTHLQVIADHVFGSLYTYTPGQNKVAPELWVSQTYTVIMALLFFIVGMFYLKYREYN